MGKIKESFSDNKFKETIVKEICSKCNRDTRHKIVTSYEMNGEENCREGYTIDWYNSWQVIQCQGCEDVSFRKVHFFSEDVYQIGEDEWEDGTTITLYPKRTKHMRVVKDFINVPQKLQNIYIESLETFNNDSFILTAAGLRALVEGLCFFLEITDGPVPSDNGTIKRKTNLEGKIFGLNESGHLTEAGARFLHEHRFMGNDAVHSLKKPSRDDLSVAIDLLEHSLEAIFELPVKAEELEASRKRRAMSFTAKK
ncbi:DUF4145 domain-containing protein [Yersinia enterocolitica]|uniref:DUF4145 domain-containing protein n=1 Tax=Yersinia enterocolitica TaxID=630 RepID=UPI0037D3B923